MYERTVMTDRRKTTTQGETGRSALATVRVRRVCLRSRKDTLRRPQHVRNKIATGWFPDPSGSATGVRPDFSSIHREYDLTADNPRNDGCSACNRRDRASSVNDDSGCSFATPDHLARANNNQRGAHPDRSSTWTIVRAATVDWPHRIGADRCVFGEGL